MNTEMSGRFGLSYRHDWESQAAAAVETNTEKFIPSEQQQIVHSYLAEDIDRLQLCQLLGIPYTIDPITVENFVIY